MCTGVAKLPLCLDPEGYEAGLWFMCVQGVGQPDKKASASASASTSVSLANSNGPSVKNGEVGKIFQASGTAQAGLALTFDEDPNGGKISNQWDLTREQLLGHQEQERAGHEHHQPRL